MCLLTWRGRKDLPVSKWGKFTQDISRAGPPSGTSADAYARSRHFAYGAEPCPFVGPRPRAFSLYVPRLSVLRCIAFDIGTYISMFSLRVV